MKTLLPILKVWSLLALAAVITSCNGGGGEGDALNDAFKLDPPPPPPGNSCFSDRYATDNQLITRKLDILIIPDTSGSLNPERGAIADGFDYFINQLPVEVDFRIGVMLAHGSQSSRSGVLYKKGSEDLILDSEVLTVQEIKDGLRTKMSNPAGDGASDGGEEGIYSMMKGFEPANLAAMKAQGFFRDDAALAVIFVADEQDICAEFPAGVVPVPDGQNIEPVAYANDCLDGNGDNKYLPPVVADKIREIQNGYPLVVGGVIYNNSATIPLQGENEIGYGYMEVIEQSGGIIVDLANGDYGQGLANLGTLATTSMAPDMSFNLAVSNVDVDSITAYVDGIVVNHSYNNELNQVDLVDPRDPLSVVDITYCEQENSALSFLQIATGSFHNCGLLSSGEVKCWGRNDQGQLGLGNTNDYGDDEALKDIPAVNVGGTVAQLSAGLFHTCALLDSGDVKCWGANAFGQLGYGNTSTIGDDESPASVGTISLGGSVKKIYSGTFHNCAVMNGGSVRCWGMNSSGQLGTGNTNNIGDDEVPSSIAAVNLGVNVIQMDISTISNHTCAITSNNTLMCWGNNVSGQLGYGNTSNIGDDEAPSAAGIVSVGMGVVQVSTGNAHTCALLMDNSVKCWGQNSFGQLGQGNMLPVGDSSLPSSVSPISLANDATMVVAGSSHSCAVLADGNVSCWGQGSNGALGLGNTNNIGDDELPNSVSALNLGEAIAKLEAGFGHNCAISATGQAKCWGSNSNGQLGIGNTNMIGDDEDLSGLGFLVLE